MNAPIGYRLNRAIQGGRLESIFSPYSWRRGLNKAACQKGHSCPDRKCACGFYLYGTPLLAARLAGHQGYGQGDLLVVTEAAGYGRVFEMGDVPSSELWGFRAEYVQMRALVDLGQGIDLTPWAKHYDIPIVLVDDDVALTVEGPLMRFGFAVDSPAHIGAQIGRTVVNVPKESRIRIELWQVPLGTYIRVVRDLADETRSVIAWKKNNPVQR